MTAEEFILADPHSLRSPDRLASLPGNGMLTGTDTAVQRDALQSLFLTKLQRPPLPPDNVARPRIVAPLRRVGDYPLTLVSAPGGYGKSTAVAQALAEVAAPSVWDNG